MKFSQLTLTTPYLKHHALFYDKVEPSPLEKPFLIAASQSAAELLGVDENLYEDEKLLGILNGEEFLEGSEPFAMCYAGHQFGYFVPRLGDGRAINLGKVNGYNLQLKGSGLTVYSRQGDGRAVLRSSIREFLMSEAMHGLGIESSRAVALIGSETDVRRERVEKGAMVLRLSPTWVRFGTFEYFNAAGEFDRLKELADYVIEESFPHLRKDEDKYFKMYEQVVKNTAKTIAKWQAFGFNHGVMNTDNMSIDGRTIDYGPFSFLDDYDRYFTCNKTDTAGRYSFASQPSVGEWNLSMLARALSPLVPYERTEELLEDVYRDVFEQEFSELMYAKMGLQEEDEDDAKLYSWMLGALANAHIDYTIFFRQLSYYDGDKTAVLAYAINQKPLKDWLDAYDARLRKEHLSVKERHTMMQSVNPKYVLKNFLLQETIEKAQNGDFKMLRELLELAHNPFSENLHLKHHYRAAPAELKNSKLSCSS